MKGLAGSFVICVMLVLGGCYCSEQVKEVKETKEVPGKVITVPATGNDPVSCTARDGSRTCNCRNKCVSTATSCLCED
jgi:hypothetical protein